MIRAYSYLRFSTPDQMKGDSMRRQSQLAVDYAQRHGLELDETLKFQDLGVSAFRGANAETGRLAEFMEAVKSRAVAQGSWLLIESMDRLSRTKPRQAVRLLEAICDAGITVVTLADGRVYDARALDDDPMAFMYAFMVATRANEESATKARRLREAWKEKRRKATHAVVATKRAPSWLEVVGQGDERHFVVIDEKADVVRRVFRMAMDGVGQHRIAEALNLEGIPTADGAKHWHKSLVAKWLKSPSVIGTFVPHTVADTRRKSRHPEKAIENYYPAIIDRETFEAVAKLHSGSRERHTVHDGPKGVVNLLAGLAQCPLCHGTMTRVSKGSRGKAGKAYLVCARAKVGAGCEYRAIPQEQLEVAIVAASGAIREKAKQTATIADDLRQQVAKAKAELEQVEMRYANLSEEMQRSPSPQVRALFDNVAAVREQTESCLADLNRQMAAGGAHLVTKHAATAADALERSPLDIAAANAALRLVFNRAVISWRMDQVTLHWRHTAEWVLRVSFDAGSRLRKRRAIQTPGQSTNRKEDDDDKR